MGDVHNTLVASVPGTKRDPAKMSLAGSHRCRGRDAVGRVVRQDPPRSVSEGLPVAGQLVVEALSPALGWV